MENVLFVSLSVEQAEELIKRWVKESIQELKPENTATNLPKYRTRYEVRDIFKISLPTIDRYIKLGLIKSHRIGRRILFSEDDIRKALKEMPVKFSRR